MFTRRELLDAIAECERNPQSYPECAKLAVFYSIYDHLYPNTAVERVEETTVKKYGDTDFLTAIEGMDAEKVWLLMDELVGTLKVMQPKLYSGVMLKIDQLKD